MKKIYCFLLMALLMVLITGLFAPMILAQPALPSEIRIAVIAPLSGPLAGTAGREGKEGTTLAAKMINEAGGIRGSKLVLDFYDDRGDAQESTTIAQRVADDLRYVAVIAHFSTDSCFAALPIYEEANLSMVTAWASHADLTRRFNVSFRISPSTEIYGRANADLVMEYGDGPRVATITAITEYTLDHLKQFKERLIAKGGEIIREETFYTGDTDFTPQITNIRGSNPDVLEIIGYPREIALILRQARDLGLNAQIISTCLCAGPEVEEIAGRHLDGVLMAGGIFSLIMQGVYEGHDDVYEYYDRYKEAYGYAPRGAWDAQAFDAVRVIAHAVDQVGTDREAVLEFLTNLRDYQGLLGTFFGENRAMVPDVIFQRYNYEKKQYESISDLIDISKYIY